MQNSSLYNTKGFVNKQQLAESLWLARKARQESEKEIDLLLNRLSLLKKEDEQSKRKIEKTLQKTQSVLQIKEKNKQKSDFKMNKKQREEEELGYRQKRNGEMREIQRQEIALLKKAYIIQKQRKSEELKKMSEMNQTKINKFKTQTQFQNKQKKMQVQESLQQSKSNIEMYWTTKLGMIQTQNDKQEAAYKQLFKKRKKFPYKSVSAKREDIEQIRRLRSQEMKMQLGQKLQTAIQKPIEKYKEIYGEEDYEEMVAARKVTDKNETIKNQTQTLNLDEQPSAINQSNKNIIEDNTRQDESKQDEVKDDKKEEQKDNGEQKNDDEQKKDEQQNEEQQNKEDPEKKEDEKEEQKEEKKEQEKEEQKDEKEGNDKEDNQNGE